MYNLGGAAVNTVGTRCGGLGFDLQKNQFRNRTFLN